MDILEAVALRGTGDDCHLAVQPSHAFFPLQSLSSPPPMRNPIRYFNSPPVVIRLAAMLYARFGS